MSDNETRDHQASNLDSETENLSSNSDSDPGNPKTVQPGPSPFVGFTSSLAENCDPDINGGEGSLDTAAETQARDDGRNRVEVIAKTLAAAARQRTTFSLESYKDKDIEYSGPGLGLQLTPDPQDTMFSLSSVTNPKLASTAIDTRRFRHIQWSPYQCSLIRLNGVQRTQRPL